MPSPRRSSWEESCGAPGRPTDSEKAIITQGPYQGGPWVVRRPDVGGVDFSAWLTEQLDNERWNVISVLKKEVTQQMQNHHQLIIAEIQESLNSLPQMTAVECTSQLNGQLSSNGALSIPVVAQPMVLPVVATMSSSKDKVASNGRQVSDESGATNDTRMSVASAKSAKEHLKIDEIVVFGGCPWAINIVNTTIFELSTMVLILINVVTMAAEIEYTGLESGHLLGVASYERSAEDRWPNSADTFKYLGLAMNCLFLVELLLRYTAMGPAVAIRSAWIWLDSVIVAFGVFDMGEALGIVAGLGMNPTMIRVLRLARLLRIIKTLKSASSFHALFLLVRSVQASVNALFWSLVLLFFIMLAMGMFVNQLLITYFADESKLNSERQEVFYYFGTFITTMISMFELTMGNWVPPTRLLVNNLSQWWGIVFVIYRCCFCFAVVNVIRAVFITETGRVAASDDEIAMMTKDIKGRAYSEKLRKLFNALDGGDGTIEMTDFTEGLKDPTIKMYLSTLDLDSGDLQNLFFLLDDGDGRVSIEEFLKGVNGLKGAAKSIDVATLLRLMKDLNAKMTKDMEIDTEIARKVHAKKVPTLG